MTTGLELEFAAPPPMSFRPPPYAVSSESNLKQIRPFLPDWIRRGVVREIVKPQLLFFSHLFVVAKGEDKVRPIIDLSILNKYLVVPSFKMETALKIALNILGPLWGCKIDLKDAYFHVPVSWLFQLFLAFMIDDRIYVFQYLPFGLAVAPWAFTRIIRPVKGFLHKEGLRISSFLDDFLLLAESPEELNRISALVLDLFKRLGFSINKEKSITTPRQSLEYLGVLFLLKSQQLALPQEKVAKVSRLCKEMSQRSHASRRQLESLLGVLSFASSLVPLGRLRLLPLILWMNQNTSTETRDKLVVLGATFREGLEIWQNVKFLNTPVRMSVPTPSLQLMTDASSQGWGGGFTSPQGLGGLASGVPILFHEPAGNAGYFSFPGAFSLHSPREPSSDYVRQYDSSFVHQEPGNTEVTSPVRDLKETSGILRGILHNSSPQAPSREVECVGRPGVPSGSNFYRMVSRPGDLQGDLEQAWAFCLRSVCQQIQHTVREFLVSLSRSSGSGHQRPFDFMGPVGLNLSVSSSSFAPRGGSSSIIVPRERSSHSSLIPSFGMVSEPSTSFQRALPPPSLNVSFPGDNQRQGFPPEPFYLAASRVETIILGLVRHGYSRHVSERLVGACRDSTLKTYQSAWKNFLDFLSVQGIAHSLVSIPVVCEFLDYFCTSMEREYRTLGVYKCALRLPLLWACDLDIEGVLMQNYMRGVFNYRRPQKTKEMPRWSLNRLLEFLKGNLFEPLETASDTRLTQKALFLILLASGRRKSEIVNISRNSRVLSDSSLELTWVRGFTPKHHTPDFQPSSPSISRLISSRDSDKFLCPVRAYKAYLKRSQFWLDRNPGTLLPEVLWLFPLSAHKASADYLSDLFGILVADSRLRGEPREEVGIHQIRKLAASHAMCEGQDEEVVKSKMGFSEVRIFRKNYVAPVSKLKVACVLPGGTCIPNRTHKLSDSDSD